MPELTFRFADTSDIGPLVALINSAYRGDSSRAGWTTEADLLDGQRTDAESLRAEIDREDTSVLLAEEGVTTDDRTLLGCCQLRREPDGAGYLGMITVPPTRQGEGLGRALIAEAEHRARQWGATRMRMTVITQRTELLAFYARLGYLDTGAREPFPYGQERFGIPRRDDLEFAELAKPL